MRTEFLHNFIVVISVNSGTVLHASCEPCRASSLGRCSHLWPFCFLSLTTLKNMDPCRLNCAQVKNVLEIRARKGIRILGGYASEIQQQEEVSHFACNWFRSKARKVSVSDGDSCEWLSECPTSVVLREWRNFNVGNTAPVQLQGLQPLTSESVVGESKCITWQS